MLVLKTAPTEEPITLAELKLHLRLDSETLAGNLTPYTSLASSSHAVQDNYTVHVGTGIDVLGKESIVYLRPVNNGTGGTAGADKVADITVLWRPLVAGGYMLNA